jgi:hypothetical protein
VFLQQKEEHPLKGHAAKERFAVDKQFVGPLSTTGIIEANIPKSVTQQDLASLKILRTKSVRDIISSLRNMYFVFSIKIVNLLT